jgi:radical SAM protein with 4Fe4S-binding SPASM domain
MYNKQSMQYYINNISNYIDTCNDKYPFDITWYIYSRLKSEKNIEKSILPLKIGLKVTNYCHFNCTYCFTKKDNNYMTLETVQKIIGSLEQYPYIIYLTGGEPLLNPHIFDIIDFLYDKNILVAIHTTGALKNQELISQLSLREEKITRIQISIDSINNFSKLRPSNFDNPIQIIREFINQFKQKERIYINTVLSKLNINDVFNILDFCSDENISFLRLSTIFTEDSLLELEDLKYAYIYSEIIDYAKKKNIILTCDPLCHPWSTKTLIGLLEHQPLFCPAQKTEFEVDPNGDVYPCPFLYNSTHKLGNINNMSISEIWRSGKDELNNTVWTKNTICRNCINLENCGGGCYANAYVHKKNYDPRCCINV